MHETLTKDRIREILQQWSIPTPGVAYMAGLENRPVIAAAEGVYVYDTSGKRYLDFGSGQMAAALGHNHPRIVETVRRSLERVIHASNTYLSVDRLELHEKLGRILTPPLSKSLFLVSGSDSIEACIDLARKTTGGTDVIGLHTALHGSTSYVTRSLSFGWNRSKHAAIAPATSSIMSPFCYRCPVGQHFPGCDYLCLSSSLQLAEANFTSRPAAAIAEPVMSAGGIIAPPPGYYQALRDACHKRGMLLILDEAQTGLGKTGKMWGHQHDDVVPDIMAVSKHFGGGLPISAVCTTAEIAEQAVANGYFATRSHATDPILCAAGSASIDIVVEENLVDRAAAIERRAKSAFEKMRAEFGIIGDIRGRGVLLGVELVEDTETKTPANALAKSVRDYCEDQGLLLQTRGAQGRMNVLRLVPPMVTSDEQLDEGLAIVHDGIRHSLRAGASARPRARAASMS